MVTQNRERTEVHRRAGGGVQGFLGRKKVYRIQKEKYFPMPDYYDLTTVNQVSVKIYGIILDERYTYIIFQKQERFLVQVDGIFLL